MGSWISAQLFFWEELQDLFKSCSLVYSLAQWWHDTHGQTVLTGTMDIVGGYLTHGVTSVVLYSM